MLWSTHITAESHLTETEMWEIREKKTFITHWTELITLYIIASAMGRYEPNQIEVFYLNAFT